MRYFDCLIELRFTRYFYKIDEIFSKGRLFEVDLDCMS